MDSAVSDYIAERGTVGALEFSKFYDATYGGGKETYIDYDTADVSFYKNVMQILYLTNYTDMLTAEEKAYGLTLAPIFSMELEFDGSPDRYLCEFRRIDERRVMVTTTCMSPGGTVRSTSSDFYISTPALREVVSGFVYLLNGLEVDPDAVYQPLP